MNMNDTIKKNAPVGFDIDFDTDDVSAYPTEEEIQTGDAVKRYLEGLIKDAVPEGFNEYDTLAKRVKLGFDKHCLCGDTARKSTESKVYYDFSNADKYRVYAEKVAGRVLNTENKVASLYDTETLSACFAGLFKGDSAVYFYVCCDLKVDAKPVILGLRSFATKLTKNHGDRETVDLLVLTPDERLVALCAVDAAVLERELKTMIGF